MTPRHLLALPLCALGLTLPALSCLYLQDHFPGSELGDGGMPPSSDSAPSADLGADCPINAKCWNLTNGRHEDVMLSNNADAGLTWQHTDGGLLLSASAMVKNKADASVQFKNSILCASQLWEVQVSQSLDGYGGHTKAISNKTFDIEGIWKKEDSIPIGPITVREQSMKIDLLKFRFQAEAGIFINNNDRIWLISRVSIRCLLLEGPTP